MGSGASTELTKDQLKEKYDDVKHRLYPDQRMDVEAKFESLESPAEILECVNAHLNNPEVPTMEFEVVPTFTDKHKSLMAKHLTPELFAELKAAGATAKGYTISRAIQTGLMTPHLGVGITAGDEESWDKFKAIYYPVIQGWHGFNPETQNHTSDLDPSKLTMTDEQVSLALLGCFDLPQPKSRCIARCKTSDVYHNRPETRDNGGMFRCRQSADCNVHERQRRSEVPHSCSRSLELGGQVSSLHESR